MTNNLEIYNRLRDMHIRLKDIIYDDCYNKMPCFKQNAIDAVHSVLYLAEGVFSKDELIESDDE